MGTIVRRGTRDKPLYYALFVDSDGRRKMRRLRVPTKDEARKMLVQMEARIAGGRVGIEPLGEELRCGPLMDQWIATLTNRNQRDDKTRYERHVRPHWADCTMAEAQRLASVMKWLDLQKTATRKLSSGSMRHNMNLLSWFFSWALERGYAQVNPVRQIPVGKRPQNAVKRDAPWLRDDCDVRNLMAHLPEAIALMFYLGNRSGLRTGELAGLRMSDLAYITNGLIRVRYSYDGHLKEDKSQVGKMKWAPAPDDALATIGPWLERRRVEGAKGEDLVFPCVNSTRNTRTKSWTGFRKEYIKDKWNDAAAKCFVQMTWYQATRHSFVTRSLENGASLDEVSEAVGHSSPVVTRRFYDHHVRRSFSATLRAPVSGSIVGASAPGQRAAERI